MANKIIEIDAGVPRVFPGDYDSYLNRKRQEAETKPASVSSNGKEADVSDDAKRGRRSRRPLTAREEQQRALGRQARQLAARIDEIGAAINECETLSSALEVMFANPERFDGRTQLEASGERYRVLKEEEQSLWDEWERLSLEAEDVDRMLVELKAD